MALSDLSSQQETAEGSTLLDRAFGTLNATLDLWQKWQTSKTENMQAKASIPSTVVQPAVNSGSGINLNPTHLVYGVLAVVLALVLFPRRRAA